MNELWNKLRGPFLQLMMGIAIPLAVFKLSSGMPIPWRFVLITMTVLGLAYLFAWMNRRSGRRELAARRESVNQLMKKTAQGVVTIAMQASLQIADGKNKDEVIQWLSSMGWPGAIHEDIYKEAFALANPPFMRPVQARRIFAASSGARHVLMVIAAVGIAYGVLGPNKIVLFASFIPWWISDDLATKAWEKAGCP